MIPHSDADAPSIERGALTNLASLDPSLMLTWRAYAIDPLTDGTVITNPGVDPHTGVERGRNPVYDPAWHLWRKDDGGSEYFYVMCYPMAAGGFNQSHVKKLEADSARWIAPKDHMRIAAERQNVNNKKRKDAASADVQDRIRANESKVFDTMNSDGNGDKRAGKIFSAAGIKRRGSTGTVQKGLKEAGWYLPHEER